MLAPVEFDDESGLAAREVREVRTNGLLPDELPSGELAIAEAPPKLAFGIGLSPSQAARTACGSTVRTSHVGGLSSQDRCYRAALARAIAATLT